MNAPLEQIISVMEAEVKAAMVLLRAAFRDKDSHKTVEKDEKGGMPDYVTALDRQVEDNIRAALQAVFLDIDFVGEENGGTPTRRYFLIDPLDGTNNFSHGKPQYGISLEYIEDGEVIAAVMAAPENDVIVTALKGQGCFVNGEQVRAQPAKLRSLLLDSEMVIKPSLSLSALMAVATNVSGVRAEGSTVWSTVMLLAGKGGCGAIMASPLAPYDVAGCQLALREAGYDVCDLDFKPGCWDMTSLITAPPGAFEEMTGHIRAARYPSTAP